MEILVEFLLRLAFGFSICLAFSSPRDIEADFFRFQAWVIMGICAVAAAVVTMGLATPDADAISTSRHSLLLGLLWGACGAAYFASIVWLYRRLWLGRLLLIVQALVTLAASAAMLPAWDLNPQGLSIWGADFITGGMLLGSTTTAMLLGHWYLNNPGMKLAPLERLVGMMGLAIVARALLCGFGVAVVFSEMGQTELVFVTLRWLWGLIGLFVLTFMTWQTVKIPNTQSATGILYVGMIGVFLGELSSQLLSQGLGLPV
ncbi:MAG: hypothetical protein WDZ51_16325 [Pirellulaceae bacterium]